MNKYIVGLILIVTQNLKKEEGRQLSWTLLFGLCPTAVLLLYGEISLHYCL